MQSIRVSRLLTHCPVSTRFSHDFQVNAANAGWTAAVPERFASLDDVRQLCGTYVKGHPKWKPSNLPVLEEQPDFVPVNESTLPTNFDLRIQV